jgi:hypothetical protein
MMDWPDFVAFVAEAVARYNAHPHTTLPKIRDAEPARSGTCPPMKCGRSGYPRAGPRT